MNTTSAPSLPSGAWSSGRAPAAAQGGRRLRVWDLPLRLFHWALVAAVSTAVVTAQVGGDWMRVHGWAGIAVVGLIAFRLVWGVFGPDTARFARFAPTPASLRAYVKGTWRGVGHNPLGALSVYALLGTLAFQASSGLFANDDIAFTGPFAARIDDTLSARLTGWHHLVGEVLLWLIGLHVAAIVAYAVLKRVNLVRPMVTGWQQVSADQPVPPAERQRVRPWALVLAVVVGLGAGVVASGVWQQPAAPAADAPSTAPSPQPAW